MTITILLNCFYISGHSQGTALNFNNSTQSNAQHAILSNSALLKPNYVTVEAWAKSATWYRSGSDNTVISCTQGGGYAIYVQGSSGNLVFYAYANGAYQVASVASSGNLVNGQWHHLVGTWDGTVSRIYIDGVLKASSTPLGSSYNLSYGNTANYLFAGAESAGTSTTPEANRYFDGQIDEIRIWNTARTLTQIKNYRFKSPEDNATNLLAYYKCNNASGTTLSNSCTNTAGVNGTLVNSATWLNPSPVQYSKNALYFDGIDDVVATPLSISGMGAFTFEGWIYPTVTGSRIGFFGQNDVIEFGFLAPNAITGYTGVPGGVDNVTWNFDNSTFPLNTWHHVALTADGTNMTLYVDGILRATAAVPRVSYGTSGDLFHIGGKIWDNTGNNFSGAIDEVRVWSVARTQMQIQAAMNTEIDPATQTGLLAYYNFNAGIRSGDNTGLLKLMDETAGNNGTLQTFALSGSSSNFIAQRSGLTALPLSWVHFNAKKINETTQLIWSTANEQSTKDFVVQHSINTNSWSDIGTIAAAPGLNGTGQYSFIDFAPVSGINYYRILQRDNDGNSSFSKTISVTFSRTNAALRVYPNPVVNGEVTIELDKTGEVQLYNNDGKLMLRKTLQAGISKLNTTMLTKGIYHLSAQGEVIKLLIK